MKNRRRESRPNAINNLPGQIRRFYEMNEGLGNISVVSYPVSTHNNNLEQVRVEFTNSTCDLWEWNKNSNYNKPFSDEPSKIDERDFVWVKIEEKKKVA